MLGYYTRIKCSKVYGLLPRDELNWRQGLLKDIPIRGRRTFKPSVMCRVLLIPVGRRQRAIASETSPLPAPSSTLGPGDYVSTSKNCLKLKDVKKRQSEPQTSSCLAEHRFYAEVGIWRVPDHRAIVGLRTGFHLFAREEVVAEPHRSRG